MNRDPRRDPKPGDVLKPPAPYFSGPFLVTSVVDVPGWYSVYGFQPFIEEKQEYEIDKWRHRMESAEVIHAAD